MCLKNILLFTLALGSTVILIDSSSPNNGEAGCQGNAFRCRDGECIPDALVCDLFDDCEDGSDEDNCTSRTCGIEDFRCKSGQCTSKDARCNGNQECFDNSDEENCLQCSESEMFQPFKCHSDNMCISRELLCNTIKDCPDGSDEDRTTCQNLRCTKDEFQCAAGHCLQKQRRCNGYDSCGDNSGDTNCTKCGLVAFKCETEDKCIKKNLLCDLQPNCEDRSDESKSTCQNNGCSSQEFRCQSGQCISPQIDNAAMRCNGVADCNDGSDEANCTSCSPQAFECGIGTRKCVPKYALCNSKLECPDGTDESKANCPHGSTPPVWSASGFLSIFPDSHLTLQYLTTDLAVYYEYSVLPPSVTWPFSPLSKAWTYAKETYGSRTFASPGNQRLYVFVGRINTERDSLVAWSFRDWKSGYRNMIYVGLNMRNNGWGTETAENWDTLLSGMGSIVKTGAEGNSHSADFNICGSYMAIQVIVSYEIYIHLKGQGSAEVTRWKSSQLNDSREVGKINCFRDWVLPIYEQYGGSAVLKRYFEIYNGNWPGKEGFYVETRDGIRQFNIGEFVHFWSGAAKKDVRFLVKPAFKWNQNLLKKQFAQAQSDFPNITYTEQGAGHGGIVAGILLGVLLVAVLLGVGLKFSWPFIKNKYTVLVTQYW